MNAFHIFYSPEEKKRNFKAYFILTAILSALEWKKHHNGNLTFYADKYTADFFYQNSLSDFWDKIDDYILQKEIDPQTYDVNTFYAIGKFIAFSHEKTPCAMVDIDLVVWDNLEKILKDKKSVFTHYEKTVPHSLWYPKSSDIKKSAGYKFSENWNFDDYAVNTSFIYFSDENLKNYFIKKALEYMKNNFIDKTRNNIGNPEILFVEQRLLPMCYKDLGVYEKCSPLIDVIWDAYNGEFSKDSKEDWEFFDFDNGSLITHTWIAKHMIDYNILYRNYMCVRLIEKIIEFDDKYYDVLANIEQIKPYILLLDEYKTSEELVNKKIGSKILYRKNKKIQ